MGQALACCSTGATSHGQTLQNQIHTNNPLSQGEMANIILNHDFSTGTLEHWRIFNGRGLVAPCEPEYNCPEGFIARTGENFAVIMERENFFDAFEQDITIRVSKNSIYAVSAWVTVLGPGESSEVMATLKLKFQDTKMKYLNIGRILVNKGQWKKLEGFTFSLSSIPSEIVFYLEGPEAGMDLLIDSVTVSEIPRCEVAREENIIQNPEFRNGNKFWVRKERKIIVQEEGTSPESARQCIVRSSAIQQDISARVKCKISYEVTAKVRVFGNDVISADLQATLWFRRKNLLEQSKVISKVHVINTDWVELQGKFILNDFLTAIIRLEGSTPGVDIHVQSVIVKQSIPRPRPPAPHIMNAPFGVNIIKNSIIKDSNIDDNTGGWISHGGCTLSARDGSPQILPPIAQDSLGPLPLPLSGCYIVASDRKQNSSGPAQFITENLKLYVTYQVSAWVRIGAGATSPQNVYVTFDVDNQCINGGLVEADAAGWYEIGGSFRIEKQPDTVMVYVHGPSPGIELMVAGLQIFAVNRHARFEQLKEKINEIRTREVILKFGGPEANKWGRAAVKVKQKQNSFPFGSSISEGDIKNEEIVTFFVENFNWAVFEKELAWASTEPEKGELNYKDADELLRFCIDHQIMIWGTCIFSGMEDDIPYWVRHLNREDLEKAVQKRLTDLLIHYKEKFRHYDVSNEMLHGSFYQDAFGKIIQSNMFTKAHKLDKSATLFVNGCRVDNSCSPEKYIKHILYLQEHGAPVGGIGIKAHMDAPVGSLVCASLDKLATLGLPIWFTELDVSSTNDCIRADDLEVMLREIFAHPAVDGIMLRGFWETLMSRDNAHLVEAEGSVNEAGKKYRELKRDWLTNAEGEIDDNGEFRFRGFHGTYSVEITASNKVRKWEFNVDKKQSQLVVDFELEESQTCNCILEVLSG